MTNVNNDLILKMFNEIIKLGIKNEITISLSGMYLCITYTQEKWSSKWDEEYIMIKCNKNKYSIYEYSGGAYYYIEDFPGFDYDKDYTFEEVIEMVKYLHERNII